MTQESEQKPEYDPYQHNVFVGGSGPQPFESFLHKRAHGKTHNRRRKTPHGAVESAEMQVVERIPLPALRHPRSALPAPPIPPIPVPPRGLRPAPQPSTARPWSGAPSLRRIEGVYERKAATIELGQRTRASRPPTQWTKNVKEVPFMPPIPQTARPHYIEVSPRAIPLSGHTVHDCHNPNPIPLCALGSGG